MLFNRSSGVLLHVTSLPNSYGIGDLGPSAYRFVDWLVRSGQSLWQMLPLGVSDKHGCPYASLSAFGGDQLLISPELLVEFGLLSEHALESHEISKNDSDDVDYSNVRFSKHSLFRLAFANFKVGKVMESEYVDFCASNKSWLNDLSLFLALTNHYGDKWFKWPNNYSHYGSSEVLKFREDFSDEVEFYSFLQFIFHVQWFRLKKYANEQGVDVMGDIPIFISHHSMDVWRNPEWFKLDEKGDLTFEAGAAPDAFSETGQKWGTPLYIWSEMEKDDYSWWCDRMRYMTEMFDSIRLDHFRGFCAVWEVPHADSTAINGKWYDGPGASIFNAFKTKIGDLPLIVEDLGEITPDVLELRDNFGFPGMKILQFAFCSDEKNDNLPEFYHENFAVYTGTHDMETTNGHFWEIQSTSKERELINSYIGKKNIASAIDYSWPLIEVAMKSKAQIAIFPMQDILGLGNEARLNYPGVLKGNWKWRFDYSMLDPYAEIKLYELSKNTNRNMSYDQTSH